MAECIYMALSWGCVIGTCATKWLEFSAINLKQKFQKDWALFSSVYRSKIKPSY